MKIGLKQVVIVIGILWALGGLMWIASGQWLGIISILIGLGVFYYGWRVMK